MTRQTTNLPNLRGRSVGGSHKAWRGKSGWQDYLKAKAKLAGQKPISSALTLGTLYESPSIWRMGKDILKHLGAFKEGGRVKGVGKAKRGFGRAMRKK
jgi:hypothetical protein